MLLINKQILLVSTLGNVERTVWRICIMTLRCKGLRWWMYLSTFSAKIYSSHLAKCFSFYSFTHSFTSLLTHSFFHVDIYNFICLFIILLFPFHPLLTCFSTCLSMWLFVTVSFLVVRPAWKFISLSMNVFSAIDT